MKLCILILTISFLAAPAFAQTLVKTVEPVRVSLPDSETMTDSDRQFNELLRLELNRAANIRFTQARFDYRILTATVPITSKGLRAGFAVALAVVTKGAGDKEVNLKLNVMVAPTLNELASDAGAFLDKELKAKEKDKWH